MQIFLIWTRIGSHFTNLEVMPTWILSPHKILQILAAKKGDDSDANHAKSEYDGTYPNG